MAALILFTPTSPIAGIAAFDAAIDAETITHAENWTVTAGGTAQETAVVIATPRSGDQLVDITFSPPLSPGESYTIIADNAAVAGVPLAPGDKFFVFAALPQVAAVKANYKLLEAITWAMAEEMAYLAGRPETRTVDEFESDATVIPVESTLGFPESGSIWVAGKKYTYASITGSTFREVVPVAPYDGVPTSARSWVALDLRSVP